MMGAMPGAGLSGLLVVPPEEDTVLPELAAVLPVAPREPLPLVLLAPTVPVVCGMPALPTPVPKLGVTVVFPGPVPPGTPTPDGLPGWPAVAPLGEVPPTLLLDVPVPPLAPPVPPLAPPLDPPLEPPLCASATVENAAKAATSTGINIRIWASSSRSLVNDPGEAAFRCFAGCEQPARGATARASNDGAVERTRTSTGCPASTSS